MAQSRLTAASSATAESVPCAWIAIESICLCAGETANGAFPDKALATMVAIVANAEVGTNYYQVRGRQQPLPAERLVANLRLDCSSMMYAPSAGVEKETMPL